MAGGILKRSTLSIGAFAVAVYTGIVIWFSVNESSFVYFPDRTITTTPDQVGLKYTKVIIASAVGVKIAGWALPAKTPDSALWVLYLHGNAGNIGMPGYLEHYRQLHSLDVNILAIDYRGYGESTGEPDEAGLYQDALAAYRYLVGERHLPPEKIVVYGYSLGSAVAVDVVSRVKVAGLIVEGSFTSLPDVGQFHYPFLPVRWIAQSRFDSESKMSTILAPKLFIHALADETIPLQFGKRLFEIAIEPKKFLGVQGSHDTAHSVDANTFYSTIDVFLQSVRGKKQG